MSTPAGERNQFITFEHFVPSAESPDGFGKPVGSWVTLFSRFAKVVVDRAAEVTSGQAKSAVRSATVTILYSEQVTEKTRLVWKGRTFNVSGVVPTFDGLEMELTATEQV